MKKLLNILGFLWCLPVSILAWMVMIILYLFGQIEEFKITKALVFVWNIELDSWLRSHTMKWAGSTAGNNIIIAYNVNIVRYMETMRHEIHHCKQHYRWGIFFFPVYILECLFIWLFMKDKHPYLDNHFERAARKAAGQLVNIPREQWPDGKDDRNPWF